MTMKLRMIALGIVMATATTSIDAHAATLIVDVAGARSVSTRGGPDNSRQAFAIGAGARVTAISYGVSITANDPSFLSEASVALFSSISPASGISLTPGVDDDFSGLSAYSNAFDLTALGLDFVVGDDGLLSLEYFETVVDGGLPDSIWNSGTITVTYDAVAAAVPEPATWGMMTLGLALVAGTMRRRTRVSAMVRH